MPKTQSPELFQTDPKESLGLRTREVGNHDTLPDLRRLEIEFTSRGDRVPGRVLYPAEGSGTASYPLVLLQHGAGGSKDAPSLDAAAGPWVRGGAAVMSIDLPLHGDRVSPKMTEQLLEIVAKPREDEAGFSSFLWREFVRQSVIDMRNALNAAEALPDIDAERVVFASLSLSSILGGVFCGIDPRPRAAALAIGGGGFGPPELDPASYIGNFKPRPLLVIGAKHDERVPPVLTERLFDAAHSPKEIEWYEVSHSELPGNAFKRMWEFLRPQLGLG
jgi:dienelactone hydrolase